MCVCGEEAIFAKTSTIDDDPKAGQQRDTISQLSLDPPESVVA
jgi:hypothetical protein